MKNPLFLRRSLALICVVCFLPLFMATIRADDAAKDEGTAQEAQPNDPPSLIAMRKLAHEVKVEILDNNGNVLREAVLVEQPIIRYGDQTRAINDSTMWVWVDSQKGEGADQKSGGKKTAPRPVLFQKIEVNNHNKGNPLWTFCYSSAIDRPLQINWGKSRRSLKAIANVSTPFPASPKPAGSQKAQQFQMRSLARSLTVKENKGQASLELRGMPRPLYQYQSPQSGILNGAIFGFSVGTNPDLLVSVQLIEIEGKKHWEYTPLKMTSGSLVLLHKKEELWTADSVGSGHHETWGYFFTRRDPGIK